MARKGTIKNMGKVHREMSEARKSRKAARAVPLAKETTQPVEAHQRPPRGGAGARQIWIAPPSRRPLSHRQRYRLAVRISPTAVVPKRLFAAPGGEKLEIHVSQLVVESAAMDADGVYAKLATRAEGLTGSEAAIRLAEHGPNVLAKDQRPGLLKLLWRGVLNPLVMLLAALSIVSFATGDVWAGAMMVLMIILSVGLKLIQESKASLAAAKLKAMISVTATVLRDGATRRCYATGLRERCPFRNSSRATLFNLLRAT